MASKIKVDNITDQDDNSVISRCGATHTVTAEVYKADTIQDTSGNAYLAKCGSTVTLGGCGQTIELASGASQSGFGRSGSVNWDTTPKTTSFTAVSGTGYFVNTTSNTITMTMPSGSAGAIVSIQDYNKTFDTNSLTVAPASGEKINGGAADGDLEITTEGQGLTFVYVDGTVGWKTVHENAFTSGGVSAEYVTATGGTITCCGDFKIHTFTGPGNFCVSNGGNACGSNTVEYLVVAGGGGGGGSSNNASGGGGGGAGGFRNSPSISVTAQNYPITVGAGGGGGASPASFVGSDGSNSIFSSITSTGGGGGGNANNNNLSDGRPGGSGGGSGATFGGQNYPGLTGGTGNTPSVSPPQGSNGGTGYNSVDSAGMRGGGGGGKSEVGQPAPTVNAGGAGGDGEANSITGSSVIYAGGGGGGIYFSGGPTTPGGDGGGGDGSVNFGVAGTANKGGGGGGSGGGNPASARAGANGGSGVVIIRYRFQN